MGVTMPNATLPPPQQPLLGSDESHFNVSLTWSLANVHRPQLSREMRAEAELNRGPSAYQPYRQAKPAHVCPGTLLQSE